MCIFVGQIGGTVARRGCRHNPGMNYMQEVVDWDPGFETIYECISDGEEAQGDHFVQQCKQQSFKAIELVEEGQEYWPMEPAGAGSCEWFWLAVSDTSDPVGGEGGGDRADEAGGDSRQELGAVAGGAEAAMW